MDDLIKTYLRTVVEFTRNDDIPICAAIATIALCVYYKSSYIKYFKYYTWFVFIVNYATAIIGAYYLNAYPSPMIFYNAFIHVATYWATIGAMWLGRCVLNMILNPTGSRYVIN